jgi:vesicle transport through interaction with t-SNAREs 1
MRRKLTSSQIAQMRLELQNIPTSARTRLNSRQSGYASTLESSKRKLRSLADDRSALFGERYTDAPGDRVLDQRQQLLSGTDRLQNSSRLLQNSQRTANETEQTGANTLTELREQRERIIHTGMTLNESETYVERSVKTLRGMARRYLLLCLLESDLLCFTDR